MCETLKGEIYGIFGKRGAEAETRLKLYCADRAE